MTTSLIYRGTSMGRNMDKVMLDRRLSKAMCVIWWYREVGGKDSVNCRPAVLVHYVYLPFS
jgi:hypothetical protein